MKEVETEKGKISVFDNDKTIESGIDFLELVYSTDNSTLAINKESLSQDFFDLSTKVAGDILQKVSNYNLRLIILGDFKNITSQSLNDFIYESNKRGSVVFAESIEKAVNLLR